MATTTKGLVRARAATVIAAFGCVLTQVEADVWMGEPADEDVAYVVVQQRFAPAAERFRCEMYVARTQSTGARSWHRVASATAPTHEGIEDAVREALAAQLRAVVA